MSKIKRIKEDTLATIDAALSILNRFPDLEDGNVNLSFGTSLNPFPFLMDLFKSTAGYNQLINIISKFIASYLPAVEIAVKTLLITKLKDIISCSVNPFLTDDILKNGIIFNISEIDLIDTFRYSPFDKKIGQFYYFGVFEKEEYLDEKTGKIKERSVPIIPDDLIKCDDMNALLWFMINRANKRYVWKPTKYRHDDEFRADYPHVDGGYGDQNTADQDRMKRIYYDEPLAELNEAYNGGEMSENEYQDRKNEIESNWKTFQVKFSNKLKKEDGIVTFEFNEKSANLVDAYGQKYLQQTPYNNILHVFIGDVREKSTPEIQAIVQQQRELAENEKEQEILKDKIENKQDEIDSFKQRFIDLDESLANGKIERKDYPKELKKLNNKLEVLEKDLNDLLILQKKIYAAKHRFEHTIANIKSQLKATTDQYFPFLDATNHRNYYYGKTLIEFNIDYIWSLKLFDAKSLTARLLDCLTGMLTIDLNLSYKQQLVKNEVTKMVKMISESDDIVVSDCFFTFSNDDYDTMSRQAELRKAGLLTFNGDELSAVKINTEDILSTLNEINSNASEEKIQSVIEGSLMEISKQLTNTNYEMNDKVNFGIQMNFIENILNNLAYTLVMSVLSPKVYLLLLINLKIIGRESNFNLEEFLGQYKQLIADLIRSIRDQLLEYLQRELMIIIGDLVKELTVKLSLEQAEYYARLIKKLIACFKRQRSGLDFNIDNVDYADILPSEEEEPKNNDC
ncbi:MAG: hypothetical protein SOY02_04420 [Candidatus Onthovivens sp.]|nr:hypothetical protein [Candidatus Onthovivens sp.]